MSSIKNILIFVLVIILGIAAYFLLKTELFNSTTDGVQMVSSNAVIVYETTDPVGDWNQVVSQPIWERLNDLPALKELESQLIFLDSMAGKSGNLYQLLKGQRFTLSLHPIGKESYGFLFTITCSNENVFDFINEVELSGGRKGERHSRNYSGVNIYDSKIKGANKEFSYAIYNNVWLGSFTSFLVEDGIRHAKSPKLGKFKEAYAHLYKNDPTPGATGILRVAGEGLSDFVNDLMLEKESPLAVGLAENDYSANLEPSFSENDIQFNGVLFNNGKKSLFPQRNAQENNLIFSDLISNRAAVVSQYLLEKAESIRSIPNRAFDFKSTTMATIESELDLTRFYELLTGEMALVLSENVFSNTPNKLLFLNTKDGPKALELLKSYELKINQADSSNLFSEFHLGKEIYMLDVEEFPAHVFEGNFSGFQRSYFTQIDGMLVIGNSLRSIKILLEDVYNDNTWGKSLNQKQFLKNTQTDASFQIILNNDRFFNFLVQKTIPSWSSVFQKYASLFQSFDQITMAVSNEDQFSLTLHLDLENKESVGKLILSESRSVRFENPLIYGPAGLQNFNDKSTDFLVQDEVFNVHLVTEEGEIVFSYPLENKIISEVFQLDYYKNGKLQLVFATEDRIFALDRYGNPLPGYPILFPEDEDIAFLNLLDYDNTRDYRFFVADAKGSLYIYDKYGEILEGWNPKYTNWGPVSTKPAHHRLPSKGDFMVSLHESGILGLFNRRGEPVAGGAVRIGESLSSSYGIEEGAAEGLSRLVTINDDGEVVKVNFNGELTYRNQLLRPDRDTRFKLINDQRLDEYLWVVEEYNKLSVLKPNEELLFEMALPTDSLEYQYFSFGPNNKIFAVLDRIQEFTYLYNSEGQLINQKPIDTNQDIWINFSGSTNEYTLVTINGGNLFEYKLPY